MSDALEALEAEVVRMKAAVARLDAERDSFKAAAASMAAESAALKAEGDRLEDGNRRLEARFRELKGELCDARTREDFEKQILEASLVLKDAEEAYTEYVQACLEDEERRVLTEMLAERKDLNRAYVQAVQEVNAWGGAEEGNA